MSKTHDLVSVRKPSKVPYVGTIFTHKSVKHIAYASTPETDNNLHFVVMPTYLGSSIAYRQLAFSTEPKPKLDFPYFQAGRIMLDGEEVFLLLEESNETL